MHPPRERKVKSSYIEAINDIKKLFCDNEELKNYLDLLLNNMHLRDEEKERVVNQYFNYYDNQEVETINININTRDNIDYEGNDCSDSDDLDASSSDSQDIEFYLNHKLVNSIKSNPPKEDKPVLSGYDFSEAFYEFQLSLLQMQCSFSLENHVQHVLYVFIYQKCRWGSQNAF